MTANLTDNDYIALAEFGFALRRFQMFSKAKAAAAGLTSLCMAGREPMPSDRRRMLLRLTLLGRGILSDLALAHREEIRLLQQGLSSMPSG